MRSLDDGPFGSRHRFTQLFRLLALIAVVLISFISPLRRYRIASDPDLFHLRHEALPNGTAILSNGINRSESPNETVTVVYEEGTVDKNNIGDIASEHTNGEENDFDEILWPRLKEKVCPRGAPKTSLGTTLFELGRVELGLEANATATPNSPETALRNKKRTAKFFYDGGFGFTLFIDSSDPTSNLFYASVWKCANNQIHSYLEHLFNHRANGKVRDHSRQDGYANDTYLESIKISDLELMFYEELDRQNGYAKAHNEDNHYFTFNETARTKPCVFTVLRDPISHFLSGYNEIEYRLIEDCGGAPHRLEESKRLGSYTTIPFDQGSHKREKRFETFVKNLLKEHPSFSLFDYYKHFASMSRILPTLSRFNLIPIKTETEKIGPSWFLPTLENLTETFPTFLADRCPSIARNYQRRQQDMILKSNKTSLDSSNTTNKPSLPAMERMGLHESSNDEFGTYKAAKDVWKKGGPTARALCVLHVVDYACFGHDVPLLCKDVYSSDRFVERILSAQ